VYHNDYEFESGTNAIIVTKDGQTIAGWNHTSGIGWAK